MSEDELKSKCEWIPIDTAPKDREIIVLAQEILPKNIKKDFNTEVEPLKPLIAITSYDEYGGFCICEIRKTTHWMPLPEIPKIDSEKEHEKNNIRILDNILK